MLWLILGGGACMVGVLTWLFVYGASRASRVHERRLDDEDYRQTR